MGSGGAPNESWRESQGFRNPRARKPLAQTCNAVRRPDFRAPTTRIRSPLWDERKIQGHP
jgi:hypothetical protein